MGMAATFERAFAASGMAPWEISPPGIRPTMRVLAYFHTFNDAEVVEQALESLANQTRQAQAILIVDNASTDATLDRPFPKHVAVIRNQANLGTSGAVCVGFEFARTHGFDWIWVLDADSVPEPDALGTLLAFYERLTPPEKETVCFLACRIAAREGYARHEPMVFTESGGMVALPEPGADYSRCDCALWSGCLFRVTAIRKIGLPRAEYVLDWGELEYGYRAQCLGLTIFWAH